MDQIPANSGSFSPKFRGSAGLVRRVEFVCQFWIMFHAVVHICAEASVAKDYSLAGFDEFNSAGLCVRESVALSNLQPLDSSVFITNDPFNVDPQSDGDT